MKKILFYCQYLSGMGHLVRATEILRSLVRNFKVCFVHGGQIVPSFEIPKAVEVVNLPALRIENGKLKVVNGSQSLKAVKENRKHQLIALFERFQPDCLMTEFFPFGRRPLSFELLPLLEHARSSGHPIKIVCSLRDIVMTQHYRDRVEKEERVCQLMNQYFDLLLVHSDPRLRKLEDNFSRVQDLTCEIHYTGYVAQSSAATPALTNMDMFALSEDKPIVVASVGGGKHGYELLNSIVKASAILEQSLPHRIYAFAGPFMPREKFLNLQQAAAARSNVTVQQYTSHLMNYMKKSDLSISLAGYNTIMNILRTGVRAMVLPSQSEQFEEQNIRAEKLEKMQCLEVIKPSDLEPDHFAQKMINQLNQKPRANIPILFDLQGAQKTTLLLREALQREIVTAEFP